jgi:GNAT superfamily N-acetyltransferase
MVNPTRPTSGHFASKLASVSLRSFRSGWRRIGTSSFDIWDADIQDETQLREWYDVWRAGQPDRPPDLIPSWESARVPLATPRTDFDISLFGVRDAGTLVGVALLNLPMEDNPTVAYADLVTHTDHRRRGVGTALLGELESRSRAAGRERLLTEVFVPAGQEHGSTGDQLFAESQGYAVANREGMKAVRLDEAERLWPALEHEVEAALGDYRVVTWRDACPEEYVESFGRALSRVMSLIPQGDLELEDREWNVERVRAAEDQRVGIGLTTFESAALAPDGTVVGLTGVRANLADPRVARIGVTMVLPEHRGHRLGLATKLASHRALREHVPGCHLVVTSNAEVNTHMNAINEALGYRQLETLVEYHKRL